MRALFILSIALLTSCSATGDPCVTDSECFAGEVCNDGFCGAPILSIDTDAATTDQSGVADTANPSDATNGPDTSIGQDLREADLSNPPDVGMAPDDGVPMHACFADPFDVCEDDENPNNNSFPGESFTPTTRGCQSSGFVPLDETRAGRMCALDPEDMYYFLVVECDDDEPGMVIEATLDVKDDCDPAHIWFDVEQIGTSCANPNPDSDKQLRCETLVTGERRISVIWPGASLPTVSSIRYSIQTPDRQDIQFDYDLRIVVREP